MLVLCWISRLAVASLIIMLALSLPYPEMVGFWWFVRILLTLLVWGLAVVSGIKREFHSYSGGVSDKSAMPWGKEEM